MTDRDPPRLTQRGEAGPSSLREALSTARQAGPSAEELAEIAGQLESVLGPAFGAPASVPSTAPSPHDAWSTAPAKAWHSAATTGVGAVSMAVKVGLAVVAAGVLGGAVALRAFSSNAPLGVLEHPTASASPAPAADLPSNDVAAHTVETAPPTRSEPPPARHRASAPKAAAPKAAAEVGPSSFGSIPSISVGSPSTPARPAEVAPHAALSEVALLAQARELVARTPDRALELTREHETRFSTSAFEQEREVIALEALAKLGRTDELRTRATALLTRLPNSIHRRRVEQLLRLSEATP